MVFRNDNEIKLLEIVANIKGCALDLVPRNVRLTFARVAAVHSLSAFTASAAPPGDFCARRASPYFRRLRNPFHAAAANHALLKFLHGGIAIGVGVLILAFN